LTRRKFFEIQSNWNFFIYFPGNKAAEDKVFTAQSDTRSRVLSCLPTLLPDFIPLLIKEDGAFGPNFQQLDQKTINFGSQEEFRRRGVR
jgi:hypothetical protein